MSEKGSKQCNNIIGAARTIQTAVLVVEYLKDHLADPHTHIRRDQIVYRFKEPTSQNGFWSADIIVETHNDELDLEDSALFVNICRAFVAGRGEVWA